MNLATSCFSWYSDMSTRIKPCGKLIIINQKCELGVMYYYFIKAPSESSQCAAHNEQNIAVQVTQTIALDVTGIRSKYLRTFSPSLCKYRAICLASSVFPEISKLNNGSFRQSLNGTGPGKKWVALFLCLTFILQLMCGPIL